MGIREAVSKAYQNPIQTIRELYNSNTENGKVPAYAHNSVLGAAVGTFLPPVLACKAIDYLLWNLGKSTKTSRRAGLALKTIGAYGAFLITSPVTVPAGIVLGAVSQPVYNFVGENIKRLEAERKLSSKKSEGKNERR